MIIKIVEIKLPRIQNASQPDEHSHNGLGRNCSRRVCVLSRRRRRAVNCRRTEDCHQTWIASLI